MQTNNLYSVSPEDEALAELLLREKAAEEIIPEVFRYFLMNCFNFARINPGELDRMIETFESSDDAERPAYLSEIIALIRSAGAVEYTEKPKLSEEVVDYINAHFCDGDSVREIAARLGISYHYMCHLFKAHTGTTVSAYRNAKRIRKAERKLIETDDKISEIAGACGFESISYFTELFTAETGVSPTEFRVLQKDTVYLPFYDDNDIRLANMLPSLRLLGNVTELPADIAVHSPVYMPNKEYGFLHEAAIISYHGVLYTSWYNCPEYELRGRTPIRGKRSYDKGKTWSDIEVVADDPTGKILYCPPVYGICEDKLYLLLNQMVAGDFIHSLDCYVLDSQTDRFVRLWSKPIPFKLNTNVVELADGRLMLPGRIGKLDGFPNTPAVLISDSGRIDAEWRLVHIAPDGSLPDGEHLVFPELTAARADGRLYMFSRNDHRRVPLVYLSEDEGEHWSGAHACDIPFINSKIYAGNLKDGRCYLICNIDDARRTRLALYLSEPGRMRFTKRLILRDGNDPAFGTANVWHYPAAWEEDGRLYIIYTASFKDGTRGAVLSVVDLSKT